MRSPFNPSKSNGWAPSPIRRDFRLKALSDVGGISSSPAGRRAFCRQISWELWAGGFPWLWMDNEVKNIWTSWNHQFRNGKNRDFLILEKRASFPTNPTNMKYLSMSRMMYQYTTCKNAVEFVWRPHCREKTLCTYGKGQQSPNHLLVLSREWGMIYKIFIFKFV